MARRKADPEKVMARRLKEGRGQGHGPDYLPYITVRDVPSYGFSTRVKGWKTGRQHQFLSNLEFYYFLVLDWAEDVIDIREQYPLPLNETLKIAERLGIKHPSDPATQKPVVMTTDFLIDKMTGEGVVILARTVKPSESLNSARVIEKFEIERTYWAEKNISWGIVTDLEIPKVLARNVEIVHEARNLENFEGISSFTLSNVEPLLFELASCETLSLAKAALMVDEKLGLEPGTSLWCAKHLLARRLWLLDMLSPLNLSQHVCITRTESTPK